jgi:ectoine hydroxylase-related dioxygenase (phytanoyl-CoA dioxygenase family)
MNAEGFIHLRSLFSTRDLSEALQDQSILEHERVGFPEDHVYLKLFEHPKVKKAIVEILMTPEYHLTTFSSNTLFKGKDTRGYHVDWPYHKYNTDADNLNVVYDGTSVEGVQCIIPLDSFTIENGATMYIPYSHLARRYPTLKILQRGTFQAENKAYPCKKKYFLANVGDMVIYPATLWHSAGLNTSDMPRRSLLANFSPIHVPKKDYCEISGK